MLVAFAFSCALASAAQVQADASSVAQAQSPPVSGAAPTPAAPAPVAPSSAPSAPIDPAAAPAPQVLRLPAGTVIEVELVDPLSSSTNRLADKFAIRLAQPIAKDGVEIVAAGAAGQGEVIDAAKAGMGGKQGKLIISARYLDLNGRRVRIRGMTLMASGKSRVDLATGMLLVPYVGLAAGFVQGGEIEIPAGARATVKLAEDVELPVTTPLQTTGKL
jgi:hypothetical protein